MGRVEFYSVLLSVLLGWIGAEIALEGKQDARERDRTSMALEISQRQIDSLGLSIASINARLNAWVARRDAEELLGVVPDAVTEPDREETEKPPGDGSR